MTIRLSKAGKMPCRSWSLQALTTCPGSIGDKGTLVDACKGCYATGGNYRFPNVKQPRESNQKDWKRAAWVSDMVAELDNDRYFRWFDSGDVYSLKLAEKILAVMKATPWVKHWLPTRMHKFVKFHGVFAAMESLPNVVVRYSSDSVTGKTVAGRNTSTIIPPVDTTNRRQTIFLTVCESSTREGKCGPCRACWNQDVSVIAYPAHGKTMLKLINLKEVA
jgi:hypothetical protein